MIQRIRKVLAAKIGDPSLIPGTYVVEGEIQLCVHCGKHSQAQLKTGELGWAPIDPSLGQNWPHRGQPAHHARFRTVGRC